MITRQLTRREWLAATVAAAAAGTTRHLWAQAGATSAGPQLLGGLVVRNTRPLDAEAPLGALESWQTAPEHFFVRSHFGPPQSLPLHWTLTVDGEVNRPYTVSLDDIRGMPAQTHAVTLECAGNGRGVFMLPKTSGVQWGRGGVSNATWTGVPLSALIERAAPKATAQHFWMEALDHAPLPTVPRFLRSIPRDVALGDAFVAFEMNGRPIPLLHGGPLRLIVPGWFGMASTKWLTHVHALPRVSDNYFMAHGYRYGDQSPVEQMKVKSVIATPLTDVHVKSGEITLKGQAWSGAKSGGIRAVDVSLDAGRTWRSARLVGSNQSGAWRSWELPVHLTARGPQSAMARATDVSGAVQPLAASSNPGGYGNNSIQEISFVVA